jgi:hypothetical protein
LFHARKASRLFELTLVLVRFDPVALTDLTHFRIFPRNLAPDFTHYLSEQPEMSSHDEASKKGQNNESKIMKQKRITISYSRKEQP